jgi:hypothetical protein
VHDSELETDKRWRVLAITERGGKIRREKKEKVNRTAREVWLFIAQLLVL